MSFGEESTNNKKPKPNPNQARASRQSVFITHWEDQQEASTVHGKQVTPGGKLEGDVAEEKCTSRHRPLDPVPIAQRLKAHLEWTFNSCSFPPQQHSPSQGSQHTGEHKANSSPAHCPLARLMDETEVIRTTDAEDKGMVGKHPEAGGGGGARQPWGSEKAHGTVIKYGRDYRLVFRLWRNARERLWKTQLSWRCMRSFSFTFIFSFHAVLAGS